MTEPIEVTKGQREFVRRRVAWVLKDFIAFRLSLDAALARSYTQGMSDAVEVMLESVDHRTA